MASAVSLVDDSNDDHDMYNSNDEPTHSKRPKKGSQANKALATIEFRDGKFIDVLIDLIKEINSEAIWVCSAAGGLKVQVVTSDHTTIVVWKAPPQYFKKFVCRVEKEVKFLTITKYLSQVYKMCSSSGGNRAAHTWQIFENKMDIFAISAKDGTDKQFELKIGVPDEDSIIDTGSIESPSNATVEMPAEPLNTHLLNLSRFVAGESAKPIAPPVSIVCNDATKLSLHFKTDIADGHINYLASGGDDSNGLNIEFESAYNESFPSDKLRLCLRAAPKLGRLRLELRSGFPIKFEIGDPEDPSNHIVLFTTPLSDGVCGNKDLDYDLS